MDERCLWVNLCSILRRELFGGSTHRSFKGNLLRREGRLAETDGHYPAGTCLDLEGNVQYICVWMGVPPDESALASIGSDRREGSQSGASARMVHPCRP